MIVGVRSLYEAGSFYRCVVVGANGGVCVGVGVFDAGVGGEM